MRTIKKEELITKLKENSISESFIDNLLNRITKATSGRNLSKIDKQLATVEKNKDVIKDKLRAKFIEVYGSLENTPAIQLAILDK